MTMFERGTLARRDRWLSYGGWAALSVLLVGWFWLTWLADVEKWLEVSDHVGTIVVGVSVMWACTRYLAFSRRTREAERKTARYLAWQTINSAQGKPGNGGRLDAVQDLARDEVSLAGVNLDGAFLEGLRLPSRADFRHASLRCVDHVGVVLRSAHLEGADLSEAHLDEADLSEAHLEDANLYRAHLEGANLRSARLERARLPEARLERANFLEAHLDGASLRLAHLEYSKLRMAQLVKVDLRGAFLQNADLTGANLEGANLGSAHLEGANLSRTQLSGAILTDVTWGLESTVLRGAHVFGLQGAPGGFREWALANGATE